MYSFEKHFYGMLRIVWLGFFEWGLRSHCSRSEMEEKYISLKYSSYLSSSMVDNYKF